MKRSGISLLCDAGYVSHLHDRVEGHTSIYKYYNLVFAPSFSFVCVGKKACEQSNFSCRFHQFCFVSVYVMTVSCMLVVLREVTSLSRKFSFHNLVDLLLFLFLIRCVTCKCWFPCDHYDRCGSSFDGITFVD